MRVNVLSVGKPWKPEESADPLWTVVIENQSEPCKTYDPQLAQVGWHDAETFKSRSGKEYWRSPKTPQTASTRPTEGFKGKDEAAIKAMWAIGQSIQSLPITGLEPSDDNIEQMANVLFAMVDRVKDPTQEVMHDAGDFMKVDFDS